MIRVLVLIAVTGFLVSVVTISSAVAIAGPDLITEAVWHSWGGHGNWNFGWNDDDDRGDYDRHDRHDRHDSAQGTREIAWTGGDSLDIDVPADITYTQAPGPGKLTITGPQRAIDALELDGGDLRLRHGGRHRVDGLTIVMTAPGVTHFNVEGSGRLDIRDYKQDKLTLEVSGDTIVNARGDARSLVLSVSGASETDLADLKVSDADVNIDGSGRATLAPTGAAIVDISGSGDVTLLSKPAKLESNVSGSGSLHQKDGVAPAPPSPPTPPKKPGKKT